MSDRNKLRNIRIGLEVFERHGGKDCDAQHDEFFAGQADGEMLSEEEIKTLRDAGWCISGDQCRGCANGDTEAEARGVVFVHDKGDPTYERKHYCTCNEWSIST